MMAAAVVSRVGDLRDAGRHCRVRSTYTTGTLVGKVRDVLEGLPAA
jgi:hypothetical protein